MQSGEVPCGCEPVLHTFQECAQQYLAAAWCSCLWKAVTAMALNLLSCMQATLMSQCCSCACRPSRTALSSNSEAAGCGWLWTAENSDWFLSAALHAGWICALNLLSRMQAFKDRSQQQFGSGWA